ncbi:DNA topoisomerase III [Arenicella xantha]|uniref:DNA topoisomerase n=1 Tax=Arenicella xantha TaxID=644221 RepID=A0A395JGQ5_9GAMM|nr:DNA topoisomerase III [Arenicella xantha]RBP48572.1 DNA topoisomerase-3 [Arenicella xantha]
MRLFIAEKPSLGRAIADVLPKPLRKADGYIVAANGDTVSWCIGHLLEQVEPEVYDPAFKKWSHEHLPIIPDRWQLVAKRKTSKQLAVLRKLVKQADQLIHAGDPDREGQLLVDEVINFLGVSKEKTAAVQRCLISDLNAKAVKQAVSKLRSNQEFIPLSTSALARSRADWLYGINLTRAYTLQGQKAGYNGVLSVGRVQTPVLGLVVRRDQAIESFISQPFYEVWAQLETLPEDGPVERFQAKWQPSKQCQPYLDEAGRNSSKPLAENVIKRISHQPATVMQLARQHKKQAAPLPFNLSALQIEASKAFGLSAQQVLDVCQGLYERHKLITYPRSDCRYLPKDHFTEAKLVVAAITFNSGASKAATSLFGTNSEAFKSVDIGVKSRAWNDAKVNAHHAIIPTQKKLNAAKLTSTLSAIEEKVYRLICRNYLAQFLPAYEFFDVKAEISIGTGIFLAKAKEPIKVGWKCLFPSAKPKAEADNTDQESEQKIPNLHIQQGLKSLAARLDEKHTSPPKHYTDASLLAAMTGISAHVSDSELKKVLRDTDGLGTDATRAGIIELLFKRGYLRRQGKTIFSTKTGRAFVDALPDVATHPDLTALWESRLTAIHDGLSSYQELMMPLQTQLKSMVVDSRSVVPHGLRGLGSKAQYRKKQYRKKRPRKSKSSAKV